MSGLGETTARLVKARRARSAAPAPVASRRMREVRSFGPNPGALKMWLYRPEGLSPDAPLVVTLHGCTQRAEAYAAQAGWLALADRCGFAVLAAEQVAANNPNRCFNWFEAGDIRRGEGEAASIAAMVSHAVRTERLDAARVFVTGLSAGGAMTAVMLAAYPDLFAAGAVVAGLPYGAAQGVGEAMQLMMGAGRPTDLGGAVRAAAAAGGPVPRLAIWHGDADYTVSPKNGTALLDQWTDWHGISAGGATVERRGPNTRTVVRAADGQTVLIEHNLVHGLGHGTPLSTLGPEPLGAAAPYMLEAGVSSTREIAAFWGLVEAAPAAGLSLPTMAQPAESATEAAFEGGVGGQVMASLADRVPKGVQDVIAKALRAAGLT